MKNLKLLNNFVFQIFIIFFFLTQLLATEPVDIWKSNDELEKEPTQEEKIILESKKNLLFESDENSNIEVAQEEEKNLKFKKLYGLFDPEENNLSLDMWKEADGQRLLRILDGLKKRNLSNDCSSKISSVCFLFLVFV